MLHFVRINLLPKKKNLELAETTPHSVKMASIDEVLIFSPFSFFLDSLLSDSGSPAPAGSESLSSNVMIYSGEGDGNNILEVVVGACLFFSLV